MRAIAKYLTILGALSGLVGCNDASSTGPDTQKPGDNPFTGKWSYIKFVAYENNGADTVDYTDQYKTYFMVFYDTTGRRILPSRPTSALDSLHYKYNDDSVFTTSFVDNFLNYKGRPYVFKGKNKDTLDFSDPDHIEVLIRTK